MIKALNNYVLIRPDLPTEKSLESGIILPALRKEVPQSGVIVDVPENVTHLIKGVKVWFKMWAGQDIAYEKEILKSVHVKDIIAYGNK